MDLDVYRGEIFGLVGPDGAGKTTMMRMLASILDASSGQAEILGSPLSKENEAVRDAIGYMSQKFGLYSDLTVEENIEFYADIYNVSGEERKAKKETLLTFSGLNSFKKRLAAHLSGGMKQKLGLACALIHSPELVLLDEPTNGVDPVSRRDFWNILQGLQKEGMTIVMTTSYLDEAEKCDRIGLMHEGKIISIGTLADLRKLLKGTILEITLANAREAFPYISEHFHDRARLFGNKIHLLTENPSEASEKLKAAPFPIYEIKEIIPSLEDVFVSIL